MSACISRHGEYAEHDLDADFTCTLCGVLDEGAMRAELRRLRTSRSPEPMSADRDDLARVLDEVAYWEIAAVRGLTILPTGPHSAAVPAHWQDEARAKSKPYLDAALAWFAARAAAEGPDVEAVAAVLREHPFGYDSDCGVDFGCDCGADGTEDRGAWAVHVAEQVAALRPAAREAVETAECSYCFKRPAVGETPDGDSICEECAVPMADVAETLRMAAQIVERFAAETYPADVFPSPTREAYAEINALLKRERGHRLDGVAADCYRRALANAARVLRDAADDPDLRPTAADGGA